MNIHGLSAEGVRKLKAAGERGEEETFTFSFVTGALVRSLAKQIAFETHRRGFAVLEERNDGGLITRRHYIKFRGNAWKAYIFAKAMEDFIKARNEDDRS